MATDAQLALAIVARDKATADLKKVERSLERLQKRHDSFGSSAAKAFAVGAVAAWGATTVAKFAEVQDATSALEATYGKSAKVFQQWAKTQATGYNMSAREALNAQQTFANFAKAGGLAGKQLETFTIDLTQRAADMASYYGGTVQEAIDAVSSGLMGEAEPLRRYGVLLDDATLRGKALELGLISTTKNALTPQQKVLAAQAAILEKSSQAAGDAARTQDSLANQLKQANAQWDNAQTSIGEALAVGALPMLKTANSLLGTFNQLPQPLKTAGVAIGILGTAAFVAVPKIVAMRTALIQAQVAAGKAPAAFGKYAGALKAVGVGAATAAVALPVIGSIVDKIGDSMFGTTTQASDLKDALIGIAKTGEVGDLGQFGVGLKDIGAEIEHLANPGVSQRVEDFFGTLAGNGGGEGRNRVLEQVQALDQALTEMVASGHAKEAAEALEALEGEAQAKGAPVGALTELLTGYSSASKEAARETTALGGSTKDASEKVRTLDQRISDLKDSLLRLGGATRTNEGATMALQAAQEAAAAAVKENGKGLDVTSEKGRANRQVLMDLASTALESAGAWATNGKSIAFVREKTVAARASFIRSAEAMGLSEEAAGRLADSYGLIPKVVSTRATTQGFGDAKEKAEEVKRKLDAINKNILIQIRTRYDGSQIPKEAYRAGGGAVFGPGTATSDSIPAMLSNGEYVIRASSAKRIGYGNLDRLNRYADGGKVSKKRSAAREALKDLISQRRDAVGTITSSLLGAVGLGAAFDPGRYRDLLDALKTAGDAVVAAQEKVNEARAAKVNASGPTEMAAALKAEAQASRELTEAKKAESTARKQAENAKPTAKNVGKGLHSLAERMKKFASVLRALKRKGLREDLLAQLVEMGPMDGLDEARALNAGSAKDLAGINADQARIVKTARAIGRFGAHAQYDPLIRAQRNVINGGSAEPVFVSKTVVQVDGKTLVEAAQHYKRANGDKPLGLG